MISVPNGRIRGRKEEIMTCSPVSQQVVVPVIGFTASVGNASVYLRARNAMVSRPGAGEARLGKGRDVEDRYGGSPDMIDYLAVAFVVMAVAFGPAIVSLL
jgi:hypothetical protein